MIQRYRMLRSLGVPRYKALYQALPARIQAANAAIHGETVIYRTVVYGTVQPKKNAYIAENTFYVDR